MTTQVHFKYIKILLGLYLTISAFASCTFDYFEDETNFRLYVPQVKEGTINNFYVSFHSKEGGHMLTRQLIAPFDENEFVKEGILRFKIPYGEYSVSCFADYTPNAITEGRVFHESYKGMDLLPGESDMYVSRSTNPRVFLSSAMVYPLGHPRSKDVQKVDIDEKQQYKGAVQAIFKELPALVQRIDILYKGLATKVNLDGLMSRFSDSDRILASFEVASYRKPNGDVELPADILSPSVGIRFGNMPPLSSTDTPINVLGFEREQGEYESLELEVRFYGSDSSQMLGTSYFTKDDLYRLPVDKKPVDENGLPIEDLVLRPQKMIIFTFKNFLVVGITIQGWGDIIQGPITPM